MKIAYRHAFVAALCAFSPAFAWAQSSETQTVEVQTSTGDSSTYYLSDAVDQPTRSPSDQEVAPLTGIQVQAPSCDGPVACGGCNDSCGHSSWLSRSCWLGDYAECENTEPWTLMDHFPCLKERGHTIGGWIEMGYQDKPDGAFTGNGPFLDDREWTGFNLNQAYVYVGKQTKTEGCGWDWGYRADLIYGVDGNEAQSFGNVNPGHFDYLNGWDHGIYEWGMPQLYGEVAYNDLTLKIGHFYTPTGYEVVPPLGNFFFSRQITWYQGEPFTHTGALGTYKYSDKLILTAGWALGWDTGFYQFNGGNIAILGAAWTISDEVSLTYFGAYGNSGWRGSRSNLSGLILSIKWTEKVSTVHQADVFGSNNGADLVAPGGNFAVDGIAGDDVASVNYIFYNFTDKLRGGIRQEWYKADGVSYNTLTGGFNVKATPNLMIRPEVRYLWAPGVPGGPPGTIANNVERVYGDNVVFGIDAVLTF